MTPEPSQRYINISQLNNLMKTMENSDMLSLMKDETTHNLWQHSVDSRLCQLHVDIKDTRNELKSDIIELRTELKSDINKLTDKISTNNKWAIGLFISLLMLILSGFGLVLRSISLLQ